MSTDIEVKEILASLKEIADDSVELLNEKEDTIPNADNIKNIINDFFEGDILKISLVGQYSAGKSTIISALTGNQDILIDADIATDDVSEYAWNGVTIMDTPGLYTDRPEHDDRTKDAIKSSDLLIYVLTSDLFDDVILNNFKHLAYEEAYRHKMMLVVNKMSMESGDYDSLRKNYGQSLREALSPFDLSEFPICFIDAADYIEGTEDDDAELIEESHFGEFIDSLNQFIKNKQLLGKIDRPLRNVISELSIAMTKNQDHDSEMFYAILERIENRVKRSALKAQNEVDKIKNDIRGETISHGRLLSNKIGEEDADLELESKKVEAQIKEFVENKNVEIEKILSAERSALTDEIKDVLNSPLAEAYFGSVEEASSSLNGEQVKIIKMDNIQKNMNAINMIVGRTSEGILKFSNTGVGGFVKATAASGSDLHKGLYSVGKFFGVKFKPWGAVNAAKNLTNIAKVAGPIMAAAGVVFEVVGHVKDEVDLKRVLDAKNECYSSLVSLSQEIEQAFQKQFKDYEEEAYGAILKNIVTQREEAAARYDMSSEFHQAISRNIKELNQLSVKLNQ
ncbi:GTPase [Exiguobacterium sp. s193]|uniref:GTPase n=1 Tax=Exiguobacterium sp. s193 TaxID=2751207 RepID=UPI001BE9E7C8|nr:GTPase [Exiguobacterium sp. s193]